MRVKMMMMMMMAEQRHNRMIERLRRYNLGPIQKPGKCDKSPQDTLCEGEGLGLELELGVRPSISKWEAMGKFTKNLKA